MSSPILQGALTGLLCGISLALWMAFGNPKPPLPALPVTVEGCPDFFPNATEPHLTRIVSDEK
jgi:hypothetical protein